MKQKRTPWFKAYEKPAHVGWYEVSAVNSAQLFINGSFKVAKVVMRYWDGKHWAWNHPTWAGLVPASVRYEGYDQDQWRGLVRKP